MTTVFGYWPQLALSLGEYLHWNIKLVGKNGRQNQYIEKVEGGGAYMGGLGLWVKPRGQLSSYSLRLHTLYIQWNRNKVKEE